MYSCLGIIKDVRKKTVNIYCIKSRRGLFPTFCKYRLLSEHRESFCLCQDKIFRGSLQLKATTSKVTIKKLIKESVRNFKEKKIGKQIQTHFEPHPILKQEFVSIYMTWKVDI